MKPNVIDFGDFFAVFTQKLAMCITTRPVSFCNNSIFLFFFLPYYNWCAQLETKTQSRPRIEFVQWFKKKSFFVAVVQMSQVFARYSESF